MRVAPLMGKLLMEKNEQNRHYKDILIVKLVIRIEQPGKVEHLLILKPAILFLSEGTKSLCVTKAENKLRNSRIHEAIRSNAFKVDDGCQSISPKERDCI